MLLAACARQTSTVSTPSAWSEPQPREISSTVPVQTTPLPAPKPKASHDTATRVAHKSGSIRIALDDATAPVAQPAPAPRLKPPAPVATAEPAPPAAVAPQQEIVAQGVCVSNAKKGILCPVSGADPSPTGALADSPPFLSRGLLFLVSAVLLVAALNMVARRWT